jgi:hypothetical protein
MKILLIKDIRIMILINCIKKVKKLKMITEIIYYWSIKVKEILRVNLKLI